MSTTEGRSVAHITPTRGELFSQLVAAPIVAGLAWPALDEVEPLESSWSDEDLWHDFDERVTIYFDGVDDSVSLD